jgi:hypothetical protein
MRVFEVLSYGRKYDGRGEDVLYYAEYGFVKTETEL